MTLGRAIRAGRANHDLESGNNVWAVNEAILVTVQAFKPQSTFATSTMLRLTRPLLQQALKSSTGITGLAVHPNPLPDLTKTYESTLSALHEIPKSSVYRQSVEALTLNKLKILKGANGDVSKVEKELDEGQIEQALDVAKDELALVSNFIKYES